MSRPLQSRFDNVDRTEAQILDGLTATTDEINTVADGIAATAAEINAVCDRSARLVTTATNLTLNQASHSDRLVVVNKADGAAITLPAAAGLGSVYTVIIGTAITSNSTTIKAANASDSFVGHAYGSDDDGEGATGYTWKADSGDDTVTMNGAATGGEIGDLWEFIDIAANTWLVRGHIKQSGGSEATPFSATVS